MRQQLMGACCLLALSLAGCSNTGEGDSGQEQISGGDGDGDGDGDIDGDIPNSSYCSGVASWDANQAAFEEEVLDLVNIERSQGASCGQFGSFGATHSLRMEGRLRCAARVHSLDMSVRMYFDHTNPDGEDPFDRMELAGYSFSTAGENIAQGYPDPASVVQGWMGSDGHCRNIMSPDFTEIGVGYVANGVLWTQVFGTPL